MPSILDQIERKKSYDEESGLARAAGNAAWADTFASTPSSEKLRANLNLDEMIATATRRKIRRIQETDPKLGIQYARQQELLDRTLHNNEMAAKNIQLREAQFKSEVTREKAAARVDAFKAAANEDEAKDTDAFISEMEQLRASGVKFGTPEWAAGAGMARSKSPGMRSDFFDDMYKTFAPPGLTPEQAVQKARDIETAKAEVRQSFAKTPAQIEEEATARARGTAAGKPPADANKLSPGTSTTYAKALGEISGLTEQLKAAKDEDKALVQAKITKNQEIVRSLEAQHPGLRETRGLEAPKAPAFSPGTTAVKNGITYVRGDDGKWLPKQ